MTRPILYDQREARSGIPEALAAAGIAVAAEHLPVGDYLLSDRLVVERKTGADLAASVKNRRIFEQIDRMSEAFPAVVLIVEGEPVHMSEASWKGALARVLVGGVGVVRTTDRADSAAWLARMARIEGKGPTEARGRPRPRRPVEATQVAEDVLTCLPGISTVGAGRLLEHFGSLAAVFAADADELRRVAGIGPVRSTELAEVFRAGDEVD